MIGCRRFESGEEQALLAALRDSEHGPRDVALVRLGIDTGFRIQELLSVRIADLIMNGKVIDELCVQSKDMKNHKEGRKAEIFERTKMAILDCLEYLYQRGFMRADDYFFQSKTGRNQPISRSRAWWIIHGTARELGMTGPIGTHSMRKTYAHKLYAFCKQQLTKGVAIDPISVVQEALGHTSRKTTERYLDLRTSNIKWIIRGAMTQQYEG